jgi:hypothetical protein
MSYEKNIEIYKLIANFNIPLASNPTQKANDNIGDLIFIFDDQVWIRDWNDDREEQFALAVYSPEFVRMNPSIFEKQ